MIPLVYNWFAIAAVAENGVIGNGSNIPWNIPADINWFRSKTAGQILVVGRKTFESIKILNSQSKYLVLTQKKDYNIINKNVTIINSISQIPKNITANRQVWICGGKQIYEQTLENCNFLFLTTIKKAYKGDIYFPEFKHMFKFQTQIFEDDLIVIQKFKNKQLEDIN